jgi:hypothetical protein
MRIENQEKLQSLLRGLGMTTLACKDEHFAEFKDLVDGEMYLPGNTVLHLISSNLSSRH